MKGNLVVKKGNYYVVISYEDGNGNKKKKWIATGLAEKGNKRAASEMMRNIVNDFEKSFTENPPCPESEMLFSDYLRNWLAMVKPNLQVSSYGTYQMQVSVISKYFDEKRTKLKDLKPVDIRNFYTQKMAEGKSVQVCEHYHVNIRKALQSAVRADIIPSNPADKIDRPKSPKYLAKYYTREQLKTLFDVLVGHKYEHIFKLTALYGLRRSEMTGLRWSAIDFKKKTVTISHAIVQTKLDGKPVIVAKDQMKNKSSLRILPLVPFAEELLLNEMKKQKERQEIYDLGYNKKYLDYICVDEIGTLLKPSTLSCSFRCLLEKNELPTIRFHELRHSCASLLIESGVSMKQVQEWLGHSTYVTTADIYSHLDFSNKVSVGKTIGEMFSGDFTGTVQDEPPSETILHGILSGDDDEENFLDEYDTDDDIEPLTISANEEIADEKEPFQIEITQQEYADYLKWKLQAAKGQAKL